MLADGRLAESAKRQVKIFLRLLAEDDTLGFDNTSALLYGFLHNEEFTAADMCPLTQKQIGNAKEVCRFEARRETARETVLLERVVRLPLANILGDTFDLRDLAISLLTYASEEPHYAYLRQRSARLHKYRWQADWCKFIP